MEFDFDTPVNREGCGLSKHLDAPESLKRIGAMPFTGAEMDFRTAPIIIDALVERAKGGIFGSTVPDKDYLDKVVYWMKSVRQWHIDSDWIVPAHGTMSSIAIAVRAFTEEGDGVIIQPPVHPPFAQLLQRNGRRILKNRLVYEDGHYSIDFDNLEHHMKEPSTKLLILCNPHNPCTRIWNPQELSRIVELAKQNNVVIVSDEIYGELGFYGNTTVPIADIPGAADISLVCTSLGKSFNFVGTSHANTIIPSPELRDRFIAERDMQWDGSLSPFMYTSVMAAYSPEGKAWLDAMVLYVTENVRLLTDFFTTRMPRVRVADHQACCLVWVDWNGLGLTQQELREFLEEDAAIAVGYGERYGEGGEGFTRLAIGTPRAGVCAALDRLYEAARRRNFAD